jgi:NAD(P)-dependent dehydrogenase (short-subunit alcohol dehydrogenase family)
VNHKTILITGATDGIGKATALKLATFGSTIVMLSRNLEKSKAVENAAKVNFPQAKFDHILCDLADLKSVKTAAAEVLLKYPKIDVLINNAGGIFNTKSLSKDGFEMGLQVNHLAHFLLIKLLLPRILEYKENPRIINVASELHKFDKLDIKDLNLDHKFSGWTQYANTKLLNILSSKYLSQTFGVQGLQSYSLHPGVVRTSFGTNNTGIWSVFNKLPFMMTAEDASKTPVYLASQAVEKLSNGAYYKKSALASSSQKSYDAKLAIDAWQASNQLLEKAGF